MHTGTLTQNKMTVMNCWVNRNSKSAADIISSVARPQTTTTYNPRGLARGSLARGSSVITKPVDGKDIDIDQVNAPMPFSGKQFENSQCVAVSSLMRLPISPCASLVNALEPDM
jgi:magnesium-transporting ATPase (P-type)